MASVVRRRKDTSFAGIIESSEWRNLNFGLCAPSILFHLPQQRVEKHFEREVTLRAILRAHAEEHSMACAERRVHHGGAPGDHFLAHQPTGCQRSEEHTSELQSLRHLVCRLLL